MALILAALPTAAFFFKPIYSAMTISLAVSVAGILALLVYNFQWNGTGIAYQIDMHMTFFAGLAILTGLMDWRALVAYTGCVAVHHLGASFLVPTMAFPDGAPLVRVLLHGGILLLECGALIFLSQKITSLMAATRGALMTAETARLASQEAEERATKLKLSAESKADAEAERYNDLKKAASEFETEMGQLLADMNREMDQLNSASINEIVSQISQSSELVERATATSHSSRTKVTELSTSAQEIGDVVNLIRDIAGQTNLLALNATIEAARAGESGKGFAVVAAEVKGLADQTANAIQVISDQVEQIQNVSGETTNMIAAITEQMDKINAFTTHVAAAIDQQGVATNEIAVNVSTASDSTRMAADEVSSAAETAQATSSAAKTILGVSQDVKTAGQQITDRVEAFLKKAVA